MGLLAGLQRGDDRLKFPTRAITVGDMPYDRILPELRQALASVPEER